VAFRKRITARGEGTRKRVPVWHLPHWDDRRCPFDRAALGPTEVLQGLCTVAKGCRDQCVLRDAVFKALLPDLYAHWLHAPRAQGTKRGFGSHVLTKVSVHEEALWGLCEAGVLAAGSVPVWVTREGAGERARGHQPPRAFSERDVALVAGAGARGTCVQIGGEGEGGPGEGAVEADLDSWCDGLDLPGLPPAGGGEGSASNCGDWSSGAVVSQGSAASSLAALGAADAAPAPAPGPGGSRKRRRGAARAPGWGEEEVEQPQQHESECEAVLAPCTRARHDGSQEECWALGWDALREWEAAFFLQVQVPKSV
jgi:hypothetical protein